MKMHIVFLKKMGFSCVQHVLLIHTLPVTQPAIVLYLVRHLLMLALQLKNDVVPLLKLRLQHPENEYVPQFPWASLHSKGIQTE